MPDDLRLEPIATLDEAQADWDRLAELTSNPFLSWDWADTWWTTFGGDRPLALRRLVDGDGTTVAILPLYRADRARMPVVRFIGHGPGDELGPICAPADRARVATGLRRAIAEVPGPAVLLAERLPADVGWPGLLGGRPVRDESSPLIATGGATWDHWLGVRSKNFRQQVGKRRRRLERAADITFRTTTDPDRLDHDLDLLFRLHAARWAEGSSVAFTGAREHFHRMFARRALGRGWLRLWFLCADGVEVAASYCLRYGDSDWCYQVGRDPAWDDYRVGWVLLVETIRDAFDQGQAVYRFGLGDEAYKDRFADRDPGLQTVVAGDRMVGWAAASAIAGLRRLPRGPRIALARRVA